jgi:mono/diheme cytochrome c family protein
MINIQSVLFSAILWWAAASAADDALLQKGRAVYQHWCAPCHAPGAIHPGTVALAAKYQGAIPPALEQRTGMTLDFITQFVRQGVTIMPFFRKTEISDAELQAVAAYLMRNNK